MKSMIKIAAAFVLLYFTIPILMHAKIITQPDSLKLATKNISLGEKIIIESKILDENRELLIYTPKGYSKADKKYPVFFLLDAKTNFKFTAGMIQYLTSYGMIPEMIVVGISNIDRNRDMTPNKNTEHNERYRTAGGADNFLEFIEKELFTFIDENYKTHPYKILSGHSLGGLLSCFALTKKPQLFNAYISMSPSLWWNKNEMLPIIKEHFSKDGFDGYFCLTIGDEGGKETVELYDNFSKSIKTINNGRVVFKNFPTDNHATVAVSSTLFALKDLYKDWSMSFETMKSGLKSIINHYANLSKTFGYEIPVPSDILNSTGYNLLFSGQIDAAIEVFKYYVKTNPKSANAYDSLAEAYMKNDQKDLAIKNYKKSLKLNPNNTNAKEMLKQLN